MKKCEKCGVYVDQPSERCPLCQGLLSGSCEKEAPFPYIPTVYSRYHVFFRLFLFLSIAAGVICLFTDLTLSGKLGWSLITVCCEGYMWLGILVAVRKRNNIAKTVLYQAIIILPLLLILDYLTGFYRWSVNFAIPSLLTASMLAILVIAFVSKYHERRCLIYILVNAIFAAVPILLLALGWVSIPWPSFGCIGVTVLSVAAMVLFARVNTINELKRRLHL